MSAVSEFWGIVGRRGGKTRSMAVLAAYLAACIDYRTILAPGERGQLQLLSTTKDQQTALNFISGIFDGSPNLRGLVTSRTADTISLSNRIDITVNLPHSVPREAAPLLQSYVTNSPSGVTLTIRKTPTKKSCAQLDLALRQLADLSLLSSSPYARRGSLWDTYARHYGPTGKSSILVAQGTTQQLNPTISDAYIARQMEEDPEAGAAEYSGPVPHRCRSIHLARVHRGLR